MIHPDTELKFANPLIGYGVFATRFIPRGTITWVRDRLDQALTPAAIAQLPTMYHDIVLKYSFIDGAGRFVLCWDHARFVNHSCNPTCRSAGYDFEVAAAKYLHALEHGGVPLRLLFSGTLFESGPNGIQVGFVPWHLEATCELPVEVWRKLMDEYFPNSGWLRLHRETLDALSSFKAERALSSFDDVIAELVRSARHE